MKEYYVTLFNKDYLPQGISLYKSLYKSENNFILYVLCIDEETWDFLQQENLKNTKLLNLKDFEDKTLLKIKKERTLVEYCWTLTPLAVEWVLKECKEAKRVTYLDADLYFFKSPKKIFSELEESNKDVLITKHAYSPENDYSHITGKYVVQFITFSRGKGEIILEDWKTKCIKWCHNKLEDGKYGDQKYLDDWQNDFPDNVHILKTESLAMGPWNMKRFPYSDCIFFHFHGLKIISSKKIFMGTYKIPNYAFEFIYKPYCQILKESINQIENKGHKVYKQTSYKRAIRIIIERNVSDIVNYLKTKLELTSFLNIK